MLYFSQHYIGCFWVVAAGPVSSATGDGPEWSRSQWLVFGYSVYNLILVYRRKRTLKTTNSKNLVNTDFYIEDFYHSKVAQLCVKLGVSYSGSF